MAKDYYDDRVFYYEEWQNARKRGNLIYAEQCKSKYKEIVIASIIKPYIIYDERMKQYPMLFIN